MLLHQAAQRAGSIDWVVAIFGKPCSGGRGDCQLQATLGEAIGEAIDVEFNDLTKFAAVESRENDYVVEAVEELRFERCSNHCHNGILAFFNAELLVDQELRAEVRSQNQNHVSKVNGSTLAIG